MRSRRGEGQTWCSNYAAHSRCMGTFENGFSVRTAPVCARASAVVAAVASTRASLASRRASTVALSAASKHVVRAASAANAPSRSHSNSAAVLGILAV